MEAAVTSAWMKTRDVAEKLGGVTDMTVYRLVDEGLIRHLQLNPLGKRSTLRFRPEWVDEYLAQHTTGGKSSE